MTLCHEAVAPTLVVTDSECSQVTHEVTREVARVVDPGPQPQGRSRGGGEKRELGLVPGVEAKPSIFEDGCPVRHASVKTKKPQHGEAHWG